MSSVTKQANGTWRARYRDPDGRSRSKNFDRRFDAERFLELIGSSKSQGDFIDPQRGRVLVQAWAERWWKTTVKLRPTSRQSYRKLLDNHVLPAFGDRQVASIDFMDVEDFIAAKLAGGHGPKQVRQMVSVMSLVMKSAMLGRARNDNPAKGHTVPMPSRRIRQGDVFTMDQLRRFVDNVRDPYKPAVWLMAFTGIRPSELCGLKVRAIDFQRSVVEIDTTLTPVGAYDGHRYELVEGPPKTDAGDRNVPIPAWLTQDIAAMLAARRARRNQPAGPNDWLFESVRGGKPLNRDKFRRWVVLPALRAAGLPTDFRTYDLRHTHASLLIDLGASPLEVAHRLGQTDATMVLRVYGHLFEGAQEALTDKLDALHGKTMRAARKGGPQVVNIARASTSA